MGSLDTVAETVLHRRYLQQNEDGKVVETPDEMFHRVAANLATAEAQFGGDVETTEERFYEAIDAVLKALVEAERSIEETAERTGVSVEEVRRFQQMRQRSEHKHSPPPFPELPR